MIIPKHLRGTFFERSYEGGSYVTGLTIQERPYAFRPAGIDARVVYGVKQKKKSKV